MGNKILPRYPIYIPSKGRADACLTADCLAKDGVPFVLVVEPQEAPLYTERYGASRILILPFSNLGKGSIPARNWIKDHSVKAGAERHWQLDDNMPGFYRIYQSRRLYCEAGVALRVTEDFTDRYENIAISGLNYDKFYTGHQKTKPFYLNNNKRQLLLQIRWTLPQAKICSQPTMIGATMTTTQKKKRKRMWRRKLHQR